MVISVEVKRYMRKVIQYSYEPIGNIKLVTDILSPPKNRALKNQNTNITLLLSSESVEYFKDVTKKYHMQYQKIIRQSFEEYVQH